MIFFTTFILTLILSYVARAVPEELYEPYEVTFDAQPILYDIAWDIKYDDPHGDTENVTCSNIATQYPHFVDIPDFPYIGAAFNVKQGPSCIKCWKLTNVKTRKSMFLYSIDYTPSGFKLGKKLFDSFIGTGTVGAKVEAASISPTFCIIK